MFKFFSTLFLLAVSQNSFGVPSLLEVRDAFWTEEKTLKVRWVLNEKSNILSYNIYMKCIDLDEDWRQVAHNVDKEASAWESSTRNTLQFLEFFGVDMREPMQWGDLSVVTIGYKYEIGVEIVYIDKETRRPKKSRVNLVLLPVKIFTPSVLEKEEFEKIPRKDGFEYLVAENLEYVKIKTDGTVIFLNPTDGKPYKVIDSRKSPDKYIFMLEDGRLAYIYQKPNRSELAGAYSMAKYVFVVFFGLIFLFLFFLFMVPAKLLLYLLMLKKQDIASFECVFKERINRPLDFLSLKWYIFFSKYQKAVKDVLRDTPLKTLIYFMTDFSEGYIDFLLEVDAAIESLSITQCEKIKDRIAKVIERHKLIRINIILQ